MTSNTNHKTIPGSLLNDNWFFLKPIGWSKLKKRIDKLLESADKVIARSDKVIAKFKAEQLRSTAKIKSEELTSTNNSRNIPCYNKTRVR